MENKNQTEKKNIMPMPNDWLRKIFATRLSDFLRIAIKQYCFDIVYSAFYVASSSSSRERSKHFLIPGILKQDIKIRYKNKFIFVFKMYVNIRITMCHYNFVIIIYLKVVE